MYTGQAVYKTNTFTYEGEVKGLSFHKKGKLIDYLEKLTYEGEFWEGRKNGKGKISYESGVQYEGEFLDDQPHGKGIRFLPNGVIYEGEFRKGKAYGQGRIFTEKFDIYEGIFTGDWVNAGDVFVDAEGNKLEESVDLMGNKHSKLLFYNGDVFERFINSMVREELGGDFAKIV
ncbi:MAG: hypothetical protein Q7T20_02500 [Saprospiraceae bacterium]|nr:hypothetical protein [Saprospiraceae bacterium]